MAISGNAFSPKEFEFAIGQEATCGTAKTDALFGVNVDSISFPTLNPVQVMDVRNHAGRVAQDIDVFLSKGQTVKEISFSGVLDTQIAPYLIDGLIGSSSAEDTTTSNLFRIADTYSPGEIVYGSTSGDRSLSYTVAIISPVSGKSIVMPGCVFTGLTFNADMGEESGRIKFEATMQTGKSVSFDQTVSINTDYTANYFSLGDASVRTVAGAADNLLQSFSLAIENPANFHGFSGDDFEVVSRAIPEISTTADFTMKYDANSLELDANFGGTQTATGGITRISDNAAIASATAGQFSFEMPSSIITNFAFNEGAAQLVDVSVKGISDPSQTDADASVQASLRSALNIRI